MAKGDRQAFTGALNPQRQASSDVGNQQQNNAWGQRYGYGLGGKPNGGPTAGADGTFNRGMTERNNLIFGYSDLLKSPYAAIDPNVVSGLTGITTPQIGSDSDSYKGYKGLADDPNGGLDGSTLSGLRGNIQSLTDIGNSSIGAYNKENVDAANKAIGGLTGNVEGYQKFADTGGFDDASKANFRARSNSVIPSYYQNEQNNLSTMANRSSGNPYAVNASRLSLARQGSQAASDAAQGTENNLSTMINSNKLAGLGGVQSGLSSQAGLNTNLAQGEAASRLYGLTGTVNAGQQLSKLMSDNKLSGLAGLTGIDLANLGAKGQGNALKSNNLQYLGNIGQSTRMAGLTGLNSMYGQDYQPDVNAANQGQSAINSNNQNQNQLLEMLLQMYGNVPSDNEQMFGNIMKGVGAAAGGLTGIGNFRRG